MADSGKHERNRNGPTRAWNEPTPREDWWPTEPAVALVMAPDRTQFRVEMVPPGEPTRRRGFFAILATLAILFSRGYYLPKSENPYWVVMVMRQRGPFRGFDVVAESRFDTYSPAAQYMRLLRRSLTERGEIPSPS